jgi:Domain of unknown function (DUF3943)
MKNLTKILIVFCLLSLGVSSASAADPVDWSQSNASALQDTFIMEKNFVRAAVEVVGLNLLVWSYDRYIREGGGEGFRISLNSWKENLTNGFEWDDNNFGTNQFAHPYHGSLYFNAARSNGYSFWESVPFVFAGSYGWEFFGETHHPSMNDWIATSVGGTGMGEMLHRFSAMIRDNRAKGSERTWREIGGFVVNPVGGLNRLIDGDASRYHANSAERFALNYRSQVDVGVRQTGDYKLWDSDTTRVFVNFQFDYGDPFFGDMNGPYDHFELGLQLNFNDKSVIGGVQSNGLLAGTFLSEDDSATHILAAWHHFDFVSNFQFEFGAQSLGGGLISRFETRNGLELRTHLDLSAIILGATTSDYANLSGRDYDYGPGGTAAFAAEFISNGHQFLTVSHEQHFIHTVNGNESDHSFSISQARAAVPLHNNWSLGAEFQLMLAERKYKDFPDVSVRRPEFRVFATLLMR